MLTRKILQILFLILLQSNLSGSVPDYRNITLGSFVADVALANHINIYIDEDLSASKISFYVPDIKTPAALLNALKTSLSKKGLRLRKQNNFYYISKRIDFKPSSYLYKLQYNSQDDCKSILDTMGVKYKYLSDNNSFIIYSTPTLYSRVKLLLSAVDKRDKQVKIKIMIFEYYDKDLRDVGLQIGSMFKDITKSTQTALNSIISSISTNGVTLSSNAFYSALHLLQQHNIINVKQYPFVIAKNNKLFKFEAVNNVPYLVTTTKTNANQQTEQNSIEYKDVGLKISGTSLIYNDYISLSLKLVVEDFIKNDDSLTPQTYRRLLNSDTDIKYNQVLLISGLKRTKSLVNDYSIPYLSNIPFLGKIFQYKTHSKENLNITIAIEVTKI